MLRGAALLLSITLAVAIGSAHAEGIVVRSASLKSADEGITLNADFKVDLGPSLAEVVSSGVPLYFVIEFELTRHRWYWFDEKTVYKRMQLRMSYHALSRQYRLSSGVLQQNFDTLSDALGVLQRLRNWLVLERGVALADAKYEAAVRMRLDTELLPKPLQVSALTSRGWNLESAWRRFAFRGPQQPPAPVETREPEQGSSQ